MFEVSVKSHFSGAHHLGKYRGNCSQMHGHNWEVEVFIRGRELGKSGMLVDFRKVKTELARILKKLDHRDLSRLAMFADKNPTSENIASYIYKTLARVLKKKNYSLHRVCIGETHETAASYSADEEA